MRPIQTYDYIVNGRDVDATLHMRLSNICDMLLETAGKDADIMGFGSGKIAERKLGWIISRMAVEYDSTPYLYDKLKIETWVSSNKALTNVRCFRVKDKDGKEFLRASTIWCVLDLERRRPVMLDVLGQEFMEMTADEAEPCESPKNLRPNLWSSEPLPVAFEHTVQYTDIDFNKHLNSIRYIDMMCNAMPREVMESQGRRRFVLHFCKESNYGETLPVRHLASGAEHYLEISRPDGTSACLGQLTVM